MGKPKETATTALIDKLRSGGPVVLTTVEVQRLHGAFKKITQENLQLRRGMYAVADALQRQNLQVTKTTNPDGSVGFELELVPDSEAVTVN